MRISSPVWFALVSSFVGISAEGAVVSATAEGHIVVSVADHVSHRPKTLRMEDIRGVGSSMRVTGIEALTGDHEVYVLIDDGASFEFGDKLRALRYFVRSQPANTAIGVAYITDGDLKVALPPTRDHEVAADALRAPKGGKLASSYCALSTLILGWAAGSISRDVVIITSGIDYSAPPGGVCTNAEMAIGDAQKAGVAVYAIYHPVADYPKQDWKQVDEGVVELSHVCYESGGEAYFVSHGPSEIIGPFLNDISDHLANQYLLTIRAESDTAGFRRVTLDTGINGPEVMAPARVWLEPHTPGANVTSGR